MKHTFSEIYSIQDNRILRTITYGKRSFTSLVENRADPGLGGSAGWWQSFLRGSEVYLGDAPEKSPIRSVDAFCGCGGLTLGAYQATIAAGRRFESVAAIDVDVGGLELHRANFGTQKLLEANVANLVDFHISGMRDGARFAYEPEILEASLSVEVGNIDLFLAGPPCQGHSNLNNRTRREDPRNLLYLTAVALGVGLKARAIVLENVPDVVNDRSDIVASAKALLRSSGYEWIDNCVLAADDLGAAQTRRRYFLVAMKVDSAGSPISLAALNKHLSRGAQSLKWAIGDLSVDSKSISSGLMDSVSVLSEENQIRIEHLFDNNLYDLPDSVRPDCHKNGHTYPSVYGRLSWDKPAGTITTGFMTPGRGRYIHPLQRRVITAHEAARIQSFPDTFKFILDEKSPPSKSDLAKWIGDAVPPLVGYTATLPLVLDL